MIIQTGEVSKIIGVNGDEEFEATVLQAFQDKEDLILFPWRSICLNSRIPEGRIDGPNWNDFVLEHTIIKSKENPFGWTLTEGEYHLWYAPNNKNDLERIIRFNWPCYDCCIIHRGEDLKNYKYLLEMYEHDEYNGEECRSLFIRENVKGTFKRDILPLVKPIVEKYKDCWKQQ